MGERRFSCQRCGGCCTGAPGAVWLDGDDISRLAAHLGLEAEGFERQYVRALGLKQRLYEWPGGDCVFYDVPSRSCGVYLARPRQCRTWPFWPQNLRDAEAWQRTRAACPGCGAGSE